MTSSSPVLHKRIFLRDMEVVCSIGAYDFEKLKKQRVLINIELLLPSHYHVSHDKLEETVDYNQLHKMVLRHTGGAHIQLQETLCQALYEECSCIPRVKAVRVSVRKPDIYNDSDAVGYEISSFPLGL